MQIYKTSCKSNSVDWLILFIFVSNSAMPCCVVDVVVMFLMNGKNPERVDKRLHHAKDIREIISSCVVAQWDGATGVKQLSALAAAGCVEDVIGPGKASKAASPTAPSAGQLKGPRRVRVHS